MKHLLPVIYSIRWQRLPPDFSNLEFPETTEHAVGLHRVCFELFTGTSRCSQETRSASWMLDRSLAVRSWRKSTHLGLGEPNEKNSCRWCGSNFGGRGQSFGTCLYHERFRVESNSSAPLSHVFIVSGYLGRGADPFPSSQTVVGSRGIIIDRWKEEEKTSGGSRRFFDDGKSK